MGVSDEKNVCKKVITITIKIVKKMKKPRITTQLRALYDELRDEMWGNSKYGKCASGGYIKHIYCYLAYRNTKYNSRQIMNSIGIDEGIGDANHVKLIEMYNIAADIFNKSMTGDSPELSATKNFVDHIEETMRSSDKYPDIFQPCDPREGKGSDDLAVIKKTVEYFLDVEDIAAKGQTAVVADARKAYVYLAKKYTRHVSWDIVTFIGKKRGLDNHTGKTFYDRMDVSPDYRARVMEAEEAIRSVVLFGRKSMAVYYKEMYNMIINNIEVR